MYYTQGTKNIYVQSSPTNDPQLWENKWFLFNRIIRPFNKGRYHSHCLNFFHILPRKPNLEKNYIYSNKFFHNFHLSGSSFTCPGKWVSVKTVPGTFIHLKWSSVPPDFKECWIWYSWTFFKFTSTSLFTSFLLIFENFSWISYSAFFKIRRYRRPF